MEEARAFEAKLTQIKKGTSPNKKYIEPVVVENKTSGFGQFFGRSTDS